MKSLQRIQKGFTLIELLIVIAVLGVLATVVLVAIDPVQQLARGRDAGRISSVSQLGNAMQAYVTNLGTGVYPAGVAGWQTTLLVTPGEISKVVTITPPATNCNINNDSGVCYAVNGGAGIIWTVLESKSSVTKGGCAGGTPIAAAIYDSGQGKAGIGCIATATTQPATGIGLK